MLTFCPKCSGRFTEETFSGDAIELISVAVFCASISRDFFKALFSTDCPTDWPERAPTDDALDMSIVKTHLNKFTHTQYSTK